MNPDPGRFIEVNGISLYVEEHGAGVPVLLMHGFPDSARLWRNQVPFLVGNGFRVITPDMRGFGRSGRPMPWLGMSRPRRPARRPQRSRSLA